METEEGESAIVRDPLAAELAGSKVLQQAKSRQSVAPEGSGRRFKINRIAIRTKWFDDQLRASLGVPVPPPTSHVVGTRGGEADAIPLQVVELGAGLSSRPWRLDMPQEVTWFDVDRQDVLDAKDSILKQLRCDVQYKGFDKRARHGLKCAQRTPVPADLGSDGWPEALKNAGFDPSKPAVWIAEGLIMYLDKQQVDALLCSARALSAPGSSFLTVSVTEDTIRDIKAPGSTRNTGLMKEWKFGCPDNPSEVRYCSMDCILYTITIHFPRCVCVCVLLRVV